ncbi:10885_t:CDS:2 [Racocetra fulgida]|uniref:10885_t:CDS:1 n=1 Tax=Racocetra fulgida TaxID=60492 RepID=A0A9N8VKP4_9GLOM|nr:10885_t:CDS:2 [Racocetra fulgida]
MENYHSTPNIDLSEIYYSSETVEFEELMKVVLKCLNNSKNLTADILQEITHYRKFEHSSRVIFISQCYGISQDPATGNYIMIMHYFEGGNLRQYLTNYNSRLSFGDKLGLLYTMANGLFYIHFNGLIHRDFHPGNILNRYSEELSFECIRPNKTTQYIGCYVTDLGLCKPLNEANDDESIYGVLPYVAPEICSKGLRPNLDITNIPQLLKELIVKCWDDDHLARPKASDLLELFRKWYSDQDEEFCRQYKQIEDAERPITSVSENLNELNIEDNSVAANIT